MKLLITFACALAVATAGNIHAPIAPIAYAAQHWPVIGANGVPIDTPEVQHATANHLAHKAEAHARNGDFAVYAHATPVVSSYAAAPIVSAHSAGVPVVSTYARSAPAVAAYPTSAVLPQSVNGVPLETPEVVAATSNHFAAHAEANARNGNVAIAVPIATTYAHAGPVVSSYAHAAPIVAAQPAAYPTTAVLPQSVNGVPLETPEVAAASANHFAAHAEANTRNGNVAIIAPIQSTYGAVPLVSSYVEAAPVVAAYAGHHVAYPTTAVLPQSINGVPLETPEVVAAKANHFAAHAEAKAAIHNRWRRGVIAAPLAYNSIAYGAQHLPVIGANGVPVDTAEVQQATAAHLAHKVDAHIRNGDYAIATPAYAYSGYAHDSAAVSAYSAYPYAHGSAAFGYASPLARYY